MNKRVKNLKNHFSEGRFWRLTAHDERQLGWLGPFIYLAKVIALALHNFLSKRMQVRASALTYYSVFALIPILAFIIGVARGFGFDTYIIDMLKDRFSTHMEFVTMVLGFVERYLTHANGGAFVGIGLLMLLWSVMRVFFQVEYSFNEIWGVKKNRSWARRFTDYIAIVLLVPVMILVSGGVSFYFKYAIGYFHESYFISPSLKFFLKMMPYLTTYTVFSLIYWIIPNTKVKLSRAFLAGTIAGTSFIVFRSIYVYVQTWMTTYNAVYGSLAAIPFLLLFLQITWIIVLIGAEIAFVTQCVRNYEYKQDIRNMSFRYREFSALLITNIIAKRFLEGKPAMTIDEMAKETNIPFALLNMMMDKLCRAGILTLVHRKDGEHAYLPAINMMKLTVANFFNMLDKDGSDTDNFKLHERDEFRSVWNYTCKMRSNLMRVGYDKLVKDL